MIQYGITWKEPEHQEGHAENQKTADDESQHAFSLLPSSVLAALGAVTVLRLSAKAREKRERRGFTGSTLHCAKKFTSFSLDTFVAGIENSSTSSSW
jgi:hypothetical protein